jgi:hypothetical protein
MENFFKIYKFNSFAELRIQVTVDISNNEGKSAPKVFKASEVAQLTKGKPNQALPAPYWRGGYYCVFVCARGWVCIRIRASRF